MYRVPQAGPWWPAVGAPLERGVRPQREVWMHCVPKGGSERLLVACCRSGCFSGLYSFAELLLEMSFLSFRLFCLR